MTRSLRLFGAVATLGFLLIGCPAAPPSTEAPPPPSKQPAQIEMIPASYTPAPARPKDAAASYADQARQKLENPTKHPELNAFSEMVKIPAAQYGAAALFDLYKAKGERALFQAVGGGAGEKLEPFIAEVKRVESLLRYQYLTVPVEIPPSGPVKYADDAKFVDVLKGVALAPVLDAHSASLEGQKSDLHYPILTLSVGRKVSAQASSLKSLELGVMLQMEALPMLGKMVKSGQLSQADLRELIAALQTADGNERDFLRAADCEYFVATRRYQALELKPEELEQELDGLSARHLKLRSYLEAHGPRPSGLSDPATEAAKSKLVGKEKDVLAPYERWRTAATEASALEILAAIEIYKRDKKSYPKSLADISGSYLTRIPRDYFSKDGQFHYEVVGSGYRLQTLSVEIPGNRKGVYTW